MSDEILFKNDEYTVYRTVDECGEEYIEICDGKMHIRYIVKEKIAVIEREG